MTTVLWVLGGALAGGVLGTVLAFSVIVALWAVNELVMWAIGRRERA